MKYAIALAGALAATPAAASPVVSTFDVGGTLVATTEHAPMPLSLAGFDTSHGTLTGVGLDYKGNLHAVFNVSSIPDLTQNAFRVIPSLEVLVNGTQAYHVEFTTLLNGDNGIINAAIGPNEISIPFELRTPLPLDPAPLTLSAIVNATARSSACCTIDSINAFAIGDVTVTYVDPSESVPEPSSSLLLLAGVLGLAGVVFRRSCAGEG